MCSVVICNRPGHAWPIVLGANRDEMAGRPWRAPGPHWPDRPEVVAGLDSLSGGSWLGVNAWGVLAAVLNQPDTLGSAPDKRSRGELVLEALDHAEAGHAAEALADIEPRSYRGFHLVVADPRGAYWVRHPGEATPAPARVTVEPIPPGVSMITACDRNDTEASPRIARYLPRFRAAAAPDPDAGDWTAWQALLGSREADGDPAAGMTFRLDNGFGTVCSTLVALPARPQRLDETPRPPVMWFAPGPPDCTAFESVPVAAQLS